MLIVVYVLNFSSLVHFLTLKDAGVASGVAEAAKQAQPKQSPAAEQKGAAPAQSHQDIMQMLLGIK